MTRLQKGHTDDVFSAFEELLSEASDKVLKKLHLALVKAYNVAPHQVMIVDNLIGNSLNGVVKGEIVYRNQMEDENGDNK